MLAWLRPSRVLVHGTSMVPELLPGDRLLVVRGLPLRRGGVVVLRDPREPSREVIKRLAALPGEATTVDGRLLAAGPDEVIVLGDAPESSDSRTYGPVARAALRGRVLYRYAPPGRVGRLPPLTTGRR